jgi:hypothetical protein
MLTADLNTGKAILDRDGIAIVATGLLLLALAAALLIPQDQAELLRAFAPEHIGMLGMFARRGQ